MRFLLLTLAACVSGAAALLYEVLWVRRIGEVTGSTTVAVYVVLAVFFAGLGIGARIGGRLADRHGGRIGVFLALEALVALSAVASFPLLDLLDRAYTALAPTEWPATLALAAKGLVAVCVLAVPTLAMGGTIPALVRHAVSARGELAPRLGWLYGVNTIGGAVGVAVTMFLCFPRLEVPAILGVGALANAVAILLGRLGATSVPSHTRHETSDDVPGRSRRGLLVAAALMGLASVGLEVLWTRALSQRFLSTVYSFATILGAYLVCLGVGSLVTPLLARARLVTRGAFSVVVLIAGLAALASIVLLAAVPGDLAYGSSAETSFAERQRFELVHAVLVMSLPLLAFGLAFPLLAALTRRDHLRTGADVGAVYLANTVGAVAAPVLIGFLLLPAAGLRSSLLVVGWTLVTGGVALAIRWMERPTRARTLAAVCAASAAGIALTAATPADIRLYRHSPGDVLVEYVEGLSSSIAVVREPDGNLFLKIDNSYRLGDARTRFAQHRQGVLPLLVHPDPARALFIGMGTGSSAGAAAVVSDASLDVLEIVPELRELLDHFASINEDLAARAAADTSIRLLAVDARHFVRATPRTYDVVVGDLFVPWRAGEGSMYTREHLVAVRDVLAPSGIFCQWLPLYQLRTEEVRTITATMLEVFEHVDAYWLYFNTAQPCIGLVASREPVPIDPSRLRARTASPERRRLLDEAGYPEPTSLLGSWITGTERLAEWARGAPIETRDRPLIEFLAPIRSLDARDAHAAANVAAMLSLVTPIDSATALAAIDPSHLREIQRYQTGISHYLAGQLEALSPRRLPHAIARYAAAFLEIPSVRFVELVLVDAIQHAVTTGRYEAARPGIQALIRVERTAHVGHFIDANIALAENDPARARAALQAALRADPEHDASWELLRRVETEWPSLRDPEPFEVGPDDGNGDR